MPIDTEKMLLRQMKREEKKGKGNKETKSKVNIKEGGRNDSLST